MLALRELVCATRRGPALALSAVLLLGTAGCLATPSPRTWAGASSEAGIYGVEHGYYVRGTFLLREGTAKYWYANGQPYQEGEFTDGEPSGVWSFWHDNGVKAASGEFADGNRQGTWIRWDERGRTLGEAVFDRGLLVRGEWVPLRDATALPAGWTRQLMGPR